MPRHYTAAVSVGEDMLHASNVPPAWLLQTVTDLLVRQAVDAIGPGVAWRGRLSEHPGMNMRYVRLTIEIPDEPPQPAPVTWRLGFDPASMPLH